MVNTYNAYGYGTHLMAFIGRQTVNNIKQEIDCRATRCQQRLAKQASSLVYEYVITSTQKQLFINYHPCSNDSNLDL